MAHHTKKIKYLLIPGIITTLGVLLLILINHYTTTIENPQPTEKTGNSNASMFLENVEQTSLRDGLKEWTLNATSATLFEDDKKAVINEPVVTFYTKEKDNIHLTAQEGILKTDSNDLEVIGNVVVKNSLYQLKTQKLLYHHNKRIIHSPTPVVISNKNYNFQADTMTINLNTNKSKLIGNVKGTISGILDL